jgi:hypothetical protein
MSEVYDYDFDDGIAGDDVDLSIVTPDGQEIPIYTVTDFSWKLSQKKDRKPPMGSKGKTRRVRYKKTYEGSLKIEEANHAFLEKVEDLTPGRTPNNDEFNIGEQTVKDLCDLRNLVIRMKMPDGRIRRFYNVEFDEVSGSAAMDSPVGMDLNWTATEAKGLY